MRAKDRDVQEKTTVCGYILCLTPIGFDVQPIGGPKPLYQVVNASANNEDRDEIKRLYREDERGLVRIAGVGFFRNDRLARLSSISRIERAIPLHEVTTQLDDLRNLKDGWYEGDGFAPKRGGLDWLDYALHCQYDYRLPSPRIYPMFDGGVQLEWMIGRNDASLEVSLSERRGYWHNLNLTTDEDEERAVDLNDSNEWGWLNSKLRRLMESAE